MTKIKNFKPLLKLFEFKILNLFRISGQDGITLLLVILLLSSILSIGIGIFNLTIGELGVSGEIADSFVAFYAADEGIEKTLFLDRIVGDKVCIQNGNPIYGTDCYVDSQILSNGSGFTVKVTKSSNLTSITATGQYLCPGVPGPNICGTNAFRIVKRGFLVRYSQ